DAHLEEHGHLVCLECGAIGDLAADGQALAQSLKPAAPSWQVEHVDVELRGRCPTCVRKAERGAYTRAAPRALITSHKSRAPSGRSAAAPPPAPGSRRGSRQWPARDGVQETPQDVALEFECRDGALLLGTRAAALYHETERMLRVARRLRETVLEVLQPVRIDPGIMAQDRREPLLHDQRREQLRERRRYRIEPGPRPAEIHVGIHREANAWEQTAVRQQ